MKWVKLLRRGTAAFLAAIAVWWLVSAGGAGAAAGSLVPLGSEPDGLSRDAEPGLWGRLIIGQSPYLRHGRLLTAPQMPAQADTEAPSSEPPASDEEDTPLPDTSAQSSRVIPQTIRPGAGEPTPSADGVFLYNSSGLAVDLEAMAQADITLSGHGKGPRILIIHTHATEAYTQSDQDLYSESDPYRTIDDAHSVVRIGDEIAAAFAQAGLNVLHDRTLHDYPNYNNAYARSRATVEEYLAAYPSIGVVLDVHRDALVAEDGTVYKVMADESVLPDCAQVMLVVGSQAGNAAHTGWRDNLALAVALERELNRQAPTLARPIVLRKSAYNQFLSTGSLLVEVGSHGNTLQEALNAARVFAQTTAPVIGALLAE